MDLIVNEKPVQGKLNCDRIIRVFPRRTNATPNDQNVRFGDLGLFDQADEIHISVSFSWDMERAEKLAEQWKIIAPVKIGGPATDNCKGEFTPGMYLKKGYVITSRGCPNKCWFCEVPKKFGDDVTELKIKDGWNILDDNLLACSENHIINVFKMLQRQKYSAQFTGGLEAARLKDCHIDLLLHLRLKQLFFAYDTLNDFEPLLRASKMLKMAGIIHENKKHKARCFVLIGYPKDSFKKAEERLNQVIRLGFMPMAMFYRNNKYEFHNKIADKRKWNLFTREWSNPTIVGYKMKKLITK